MQLFFGELGERRGLVDAVLGHVAIGGPFAAGDGEQAGVVDVDGVVAGERGRASRRPPTGPAAGCPRRRSGRRRGRRFGQVERRFSE